MLWKNTYRWINKVSCMLHEYIIWLKRIIENPAAKSVIKRLSSPKKIDSVLAAYAGLREPKGITEKSCCAILSKVVKKAAEKFGINEDVLREGLKDPYYRRGLANVLRSIAEYGITMPQKLYAPFLVVWNFTKKCNLRCKHCYANAGKAAKELKFEEKLELVNQLDEAGVVAISFSGGEPLIHEHFWKVAEYASKKGFHLSIATNGTLIDENVARRLRNLNFGYVEISLDASKAEIHDSFRGVKGAFRRAVEGIKTCVREGLFVGIATTATKLNVEDIPNVIDFAIELGAGRVVVFNFIPTGRGKENANLDLSAEERGKLLEYLYDRLEEGKIQVFSTSPTYAAVALRRVVKKRGRKITPTHFANVELSSMEKYGNATIVLSEFIGGCGAGRLYCGIEPNGDITPCVFMPIVVGNAIRDGFLKVWQESEILEELRDRDSERYACKNCEYRYICGGCRARAYAYNNDILAFDPGCHIVKVIET
ncbi:MAG: radical SAM/SPASM domain-containing protein [Archaeoglobales archaeon]|nr:MAG: radical SAM/SPASM domain-containing protein [Archaeoglobales archaeon]